MRLLGLLSALILASFCAAAPEQQIATYYNSEDKSELRPLDSAQILFDDAEGQRGTFSWIVAILLKIPHGNGDSTIKHRCDGALFHPQAVLVPLHCVKRITVGNLKVRVGLFDASSESEVVYYDDKTVSGIAEHRDEDPWELVYQIAVLILSSPFELNENLGLIGIPRENDEHDESRCIVSGWTEIYDETTRAHKYKVKSVGVSIISKDTCRNDYRHFSQLHSISVEPGSNSVCAGSKEYPGLCESIIGSPLICPLASDPSQYHLVGLLVLNFGCKTDPYLPFQYANISNVSDWIDAVMTENHLETSVPTAA